MKVVILAGGMGTRLSEETVIKPKPMVEIGDKPILWHIMKWYADFGFQEFSILIIQKNFYFQKKRINKKIITKIDFLLSKKSFFMRKLYTNKCLKK